MYNAYKCAMPPHQLGKSWNGSHVSILLLPQFYGSHPTFKHAGVQVLQLLLLLSMPSLGQPFQAHTI